MHELLISGFTGRKNTALYCAGIPFLDALVVRRIASDIV